MNLRFISAKERQAARLTDSRGFSLVEIVLAIGIVSFALLTLVGLFSGMMKSAGENSDRRSLLEAVDSLRATLNTSDSVGETSSERFARIYDWVNNGQTQDLAYITFRADATDTPSSNGANICSKWLTDWSSESSYDRARVGRWGQVTLAFSQSNNPTPTLAPNASGYSPAVLMLQADFRNVPAPGVGTNVTPDMSAIIGVMR